MALGMQAKDAKGSVLITDDDPEVRTIVRLALEENGYDVVEAGDGEQVIEAIRSEDTSLLTDVIICDVRMPRINGIDTVSFLLEQLPAISIIVLLDIQICSSRRLLYNKGSWNTW